MSLLKEQYETDSISQTEKEAHSPNYSNHISIVDVNKRSNFETPTGHFRIAVTSNEFELASSVQRVPTNDAPSNLQKSSEISSDLTRPRGRQTPYLVDQYISFIQDPIKKDSTLGNIASIDGKDSSPPINFED